MSTHRFLRTVARWLVVAVAAGCVGPRAALGAEAPADGAAAAAQPTVLVLGVARDLVSLSAGERDGITKGTEFRILREGAEVARVRVVDVSFVTSRAKVVSGLAAQQLRPNDRGEMIGTPPPPRRGARFPWAALVGAGVLALVVIGAVRQKGEGAPQTAGGVADIQIH